MVHIVDAERIAVDEGTHPSPSPAMRFAYADPPYLGCGQRRYGALHEDAADFDSLDAHAEPCGTLGSNLT